CIRLREYQIKQDKEADNNDGAEQQYFTNRGSNKGKGGKAIGGSSVHCRLCKNNKHQTWDCPQRKGKGYSCFKCGKEDHRMEDCKEINNSTLYMQEESDDEN